MSLNKAMIIGNLGQDPDVNYTQSNTAVANLNIATTERFKDKNGEFQERTEWHRVVLWGRKAEVAQEYLKQGSKVYIEGTIQTREWEDKEGQKRYTTEINGHIMTMLDRKDDVSGAGGSQQSRQPQSSQSQTTVPDTFDDMDDDLPFIWLLMIGGAGLMQMIFNANIL